MEERDKGDRRYHQFLIPVIAVLILCMTMQFAYEIRRQRKLSKELELAVSELDAVRVRKENAEISLTELEDRIGSVRRLPEEEEEARRQFFRKAQELEEMVQNGETDVRIAYLTFDDGPYELTDRYLDVLDDYGVLATFFQRGRDWDEYGEIYTRVAHSGHTVGNHTFSHKIRGGIYRSVQSFMDDVLKNRDFIEEHLGITTHVLRFPGGSGTAGSLKQGIIEELRKEGYAYVNWNSATLDGMYDLSADEYRDNVLYKTGDRAFLVVLMHDYNKETLKALPEIIEGLQEQGYVFLPLFYESLAVNR